MSEHKLVHKKKIYIQEEIWKKVPETYILTQMTFLYILLVYFLQFRFMYFENKMRMKYIIT